MSKLSKEEIGRREGMAYAYTLVKEKGIEALEEDLRKIQSQKIKQTCNGR